MNRKNDLKIEKMTLNYHEWVPRLIIVPRNQCYQMPRSSQSRSVGDSEMVEVSVSLEALHRRNPLRSGIAYLHYGPLVLRSPVLSCSFPTEFGPSPEVLLGYCAWFDIN